MNLCDTNFQSLLHIFPENYYTNIRKKTQDNNIQLKKNRTKIYLRFSFLTSIFHDFNQTSFTRSQFTSSSIMGKKETILTFLHILLISVLPNLYYLWIKNCHIPKKDLPKSLPSKTNTFSFLISLKKEQEKIN